MLSTFLQEETSLRQWEVWCLPELLKSAPSVFCCNETGEVWSFPITIPEQKSQWGALEKARGRQDSGVLKLLSQSSVALISFMIYLLPSGRLCFLSSFTYLCGRARSQPWYVGLVAVAYRIFLVVAGRVFNCGTRTLSCGVWALIPWPGIKCGSPALGAWSLSP